MRSRWLWVLWLGGCEVSDVLIDPLREFPDAGCMAFEECDGVDNDCDGLTDEGFDFSTDLENCGACGVRCLSTGTIRECVDGMCEFISCDVGFQDLDPDEPGCEYRCPVFPPQSEICNGTDDDCDMAVDEPDELPPAPSGTCRATPGTPCEGTTVVCETRGDPPVGAWYCGYGPGVEFDPNVPDGIVADELLCDGLDGDCDGVADDPFGNLGEDCDNGMTGVCRDGGIRICDPDDPHTTTCDLTAPPDPTGVPGPEACNGLDDNCDGIIDNPTGPARVIDDMVHITHSGMDFYIYRYEASRPDAAPGAEGVRVGRACSRPGVMPWGGVSYPVALAMCAATDKRLCTAEEYQAACAGAAGWVYPYGDSFEADACNAEPMDGIPGGGDDDLLLPTGDVMLAACVSDDGVRDLSGNLKEWTNDLRGSTGGWPIVVLRGGAYDTPALGATCAFDQSRLPANAVVDTVGFRCCGDGPP